MKEVRFFYVPDVKNSTELPAEEMLHAVRVLRMKQGDELFLMDGAGYFYRAQVAMTSAKHCFYTIKETLCQKKNWRGHIHLAIAPTKDIGRIEWLAEKVTEIGIDEITFLSCRFSERKQLRIDRIEKIIISAMKQSRKGWKPIVNEMTSFGDFIRKVSATTSSTKKPSTNKFICHCYEEIKKKDLFSLLTKRNALERDVLILIGPEGDFSIEEVDLALANGFQSVTLGDSRLRTETAGLSAVTMAQLTKRERNNIFIDIKNEEGGV